MGARVAADDREHRVLDRLEEGLGQAAGRRHAEGIAVETSVLGGDPALLARDPNRDRPALALELAEHRLGRVALGRPLLRARRR